MSLGMIMRQNCSQQYGQEEINLHTWLQSVWTTTHGVTAFSNNSCESAVNCCHYQRCGATCRLFLHSSNIHENHTVLELTITTTLNFIHIYVCIYIFFFPLNSLRAATLCRLLQSQNKAKTCREHRKINSLAFQLSPSPPSAECWPVVARYALGQLCALALGECRLIACHCLHPSSYQKLV